MKKRIFSMLLVVCMVVSLLPANIFHVHADTVTKKPFYLVNGNEITGSTTNSYLMPKTWTRENTIAAGEWPQVYFLNHTDPAASAQALLELFEDRPEGTRYFELEVAPAVFAELVEDRVYYDDAAKVVKNWLETFLAEYSKIGGELDGIAVDLEYHDSHGSSVYLGKYYEANKATFDIVAKIVGNDEHYPALKDRLEKLGFDFDSTGNVPEIATAFDWYPGATQNATNFKIWNQVMDEMERDYVNECVLEPMLKYYPDGVVSNYQSASLRSYNESLIWGGKSEFYDNIYPAGNATSMNAYSGRGNGVTTAPDGYLGSWDTASAFNSALFEVKFAKDMLAVSQDVYGIDKQHIWVGGYSYGRDDENTGSDGLYGENGEYLNDVYAGSYSETAYYAETMFHLGLTTDEPFLGYIIESEETDKAGYGGVGYQACIEIFDDILKELTAVAGSSDRKPIRTDANWNGSYILSGMYAGGRNIWRLTPDEAQLTAEGKTLSTFKVEGADPTFKIDGLTISFPGGRIIESYKDENGNTVAVGTINGTQIKDNGDGTTTEKIHNAGTCGYWIETAANVEPVIVADNDRYTSDRYNSAVTPDKITTNYKVYDTVIGNTLKEGTSQNDDQNNEITIDSYSGNVDYRVNWINATETNKKGVIKAGDKEVATFNVPKGQDGAAVGTVDVEKLEITGNYTLTVEYTDPDTTSTPDDTIDENFYQNYIDDSHAVITVPGADESPVVIDFNEGDPAEYYTTSNGVAAEGNATNYNIKVEYPQDGMATVTLKGATLTATDANNALKIGNDTNKNFDLKLVVEDDSTLTADAAAIEGMMNGSITVTGAGKLTVTSNNSYAVKTTYKLIFKNAEFAAESKANNVDINDAAVWSQNADIVIDNSIVELTAEGGACLWNGAINGTDGDFDITIKNGSTVTATSRKNAWATIGCGGTITIDKSDVTINSEDASGAAGNPFASKLPVITNAHAHADGSEWDGKTFADISLFTTCSKTVVVAGTPATCTEAGTTDQISCQSCNKVLSASEPIAAKGHKYITRTENYVPATLTAPGSYDLVIICTYCDDVDEANSGPVEIPKLEVAQTVTFSYHIYYGDDFYIGQNDKGAWKSGYLLKSSMSEGDEDRHYLTRTISEENPNIILTDVGASSVNYNVKFSWPAGGQPTVYLKKANIISTGAPLKIESGAIPVTIVVEEDSQFITIDDITSASAISSTGTGMLTITSKNKAKLEAIAEENVAISAAGGLTLKDANVAALGGTVGGNTDVAYLGAIRTGTDGNPADFTVDNSTLYMTVRTSGFLYYTNNWYIINGSDVTALTIARSNKTPNVAMISVSGDVLISGSAVKFHSFTGTAQREGDKLFAEAPILRGVTAKAGSWTGVNLTDDSYKSAYEEIKTYAAEYNEAHLRTYTYFETTACEHKNAKTEATCTERAVCADCGIAYGELKPHTHDPITDCTAADVVCTVCKNVVLEKQTDHDWVDDPAVPVTCTTDGLTAGKHCRICESSHPDYIQTIIEAKGHIEVLIEGTAATCYAAGTTDGIVCETCGFVIKEQEIIDAGHDGSTVVIDPAAAATCETPSLTEGSHCSVCYAVIKPQDVGSTLPHKGGDPVKENEVAPTCNSEGHYDLVTYCKNGCGKEQSRRTVTVEKLPHKLTYTYDEANALNVFTCDVCGDYTSYDYVDYTESVAYLKFGTADGYTFSNNAPYYLRTVNGTATTDNATEHNYNLKAEFIGGELTVYLRNADLVTTNGNDDGLLIGNDTTKDFATTIVIEADSSIETYANTVERAVIYAYNTDGLKFTSVDNALLTVNPDNHGMCLASLSNTEFDDANVTFKVGGAGAFAGIWIKGNLSVNNSYVQLTKGTYVKQSLVGVLLSDSYNALTGSVYNMTIENSTFFMETGTIDKGQYGALTFTGSLTLDRSDVTLDGNYYAFNKTPHLSNMNTKTYGSWAPGTTDYSKYANTTPDYVVTTGSETANPIGGFTTVHTCLKGEDWFDVAPEKNCATYMDQVKHCVVCDASMDRLEGTAENGAVPNTADINPNWEEHVPGTPVEGDRQDATTTEEGYVEWVTPCSICNAVIESEKEILPVVKTAYIKIRSTVVTVNNTDTAPKYYKVTDDTIVEQITDPAQYNTYNIMVEYPYKDGNGDVNNTVYIHLKDLTLDAVTALATNASDKHNTGLTIGDDTYKNFACEIVVESASSITGYGAMSDLAGGAIYAVNTGGLTISSKNKTAVLTLMDKNGCTLVSNGCGLTFKNAVVVSQCNYYTNIRAVGNLLIENSNLTLEMLTNNPKYQILLSSSYNSLDATTNGSITVRNSIVNSNCKTSSTVPIWDFGGSFIIERSNVSITTNRYPFRYAPDYSGIDKPVYDEYYVSTDNNLTFAAGDDVTVEYSKQSAKNGGIYSFTATHICEGGSEVHYKEPTSDCAEYWDEYYKCVTCGGECDLQPGSNKPYESTAAHNYGDWEKKFATEATAEEDGKYYNVRTCNDCGHKDIDDNNGELYTYYKTKTGYVKIGSSDGIEITNNGIAKYYTVEGSVAIEITDPALYDTYNIKVEFPNADEEGKANETVYVYLNNNLNLEYCTGYSHALDIGSADYKDFACHIIVKSNSTIKGNGSSGSAGAIYSYINGGLTISSEEDALLTLIGANGGTISSTDCGLTLKNANIVCDAKYYFNIQVVGDFTVENSTLELMNVLDRTAGFLYAVILSTTPNALDNTTVGNIHINNSTVTSSQTFNGGAYPAFCFAEGGKLIIERSDVDLHANQYNFSYTPTIIDSTATYGQYSHTDATTAYTCDPDIAIATAHSGYMGHFVTVANPIVTVSFKGTPINVNKNDKFVYYVVDESGVLTETNEAAGNYNLKAIFRSAENKLYVYFNFNGLAVDLGDYTGLAIGTDGDSDSNNFACEIVIESETSLTSKNQSVIHAYNQDGLTITSKNNALLTMDSSNMGIVFTSKTNTFFKDANVKFEDGGYSTLRMLVSGNLELDHSSLVMESYWGAPTRAILLSNDASSLSGSYDMTVKNSVLSAATYGGAHTEADIGTLTFGGKLKIERSDITLTGRNHSISKTPAEVNDCEWTATELDKKIADGSGNAWIPSFTTTHKCGGVETLVETVDKPCYKCEVYNVTCGVYGCTNVDWSEKKIVELEATESHNWVEKDRVVSLEPTATTTGEWQVTYTCSNECGYEKTETETIPVITFSWYSADGVVNPVTVVEDKADQLYVVNGEGYLTESETDAYQVKLSYPAGGVPTMYLNGLELHNDYGIVYTSTDGVPVNVVVEEASTIDRSADGPKYYWYPALKFDTTGDVTISGSAQLTLKSRNYSGTNGIIESTKGNLIFENANIHIYGDETSIYVPVAAIKVSGGDLTVKGGNLKMDDKTKHLQKYFLVQEDANGKGGNITIQDGANVVCITTTGDNAIGVPHVDFTGTMTIHSGSTVLLGSMGQLFSNAPVLKGYSNAQYGTTAGSGLFDTDEDGNDILTITNPVAYDSANSANYASILFFSAVYDECPHTNPIAHEEIEGNCSVKHEDAYWSCDVCGKYFADEAMTRVINEGDWVGEVVSEHVKDSEKNWVKDQSTVIPATCKDEGSYWVDHYCAACGVYEFKEDSYPVTIPVNAEGHVWETLQDTVVKATSTSFGSEDQECSVCHDTRQITTPALFYGTNVDLGNTLEMNFYFYAGFAEVVGGKAVITREYANGLTDIVEVDLDTCRKSGKFFVISYNKIAAKEMCDMVSVTVYDASGNAISEIKRESVRSYALRVLEKYPDNTELVTLIADMLNYGAAMQTYFGYDTGNLANVGITDGSTDVAEFESILNPSNNSYYGTSFTMKSNISMSMYVLADSIGENGKAVVTYTNFNDEEKTVTITKHNSVGRYYVFTLDEIAVADARATLNISFYDAGGNKIVDVTESMASYMARWAETAEGVNHAVTVMKFTDAANAYFTK